MAYKYKTPVFGIPFMRDGDRLSELEERKKALIIENQLLAAKNCITNCVFEEGQYTIKENEIWLSKTGEKSAFKGIVGNAFCQISETIKWTGLSKGKRYYLYLKAKDNIFENSASVSVIAKESTPFFPEQKATLLAFVDYKDKPELNTKPYGKIYAGDMVFQIKEKNIQKIISSGGKEGVSFQINDALHVKFVTVNEYIENNNPTFSLGEIVTKVENNKIIVYNNGEKNIPMQINVIYE